MTVMASDLGRPALKSTHDIRIEVFSHTNKSPHFKQSEYTVDVSSDATAGQNITQVSAGLDGITYSLDDSFSGLFEISNDGVVSLGRKPIKSEQNRYHIIKITATNKQGESATTTLNVFLNGEKITVVATTTSSASTERCHFLSKLYNAQIRENQLGRHKLVKVTSNCEKEGRPVEYVIAQGSAEFEMDQHSGELYVLGPLDREKRSLHFIIVNVTEVGSNTSATRSTRQINPVIEHTKSKLEAWQTLIAVHVIDENDNEPQFVKLNSDGIYVFSVDWQAPVLTPIARIHAEDADGRVPLTYSISEATIPYAKHFMLNQTSGLITLSKALINDREDVYDFEVVVSDGLHNVSVPIEIYRLAPETNIVLLSADVPQHDIEDWVVERKMSELTDKDVHVLVKQAYVNDEGQVNPQRILEQSRSALDTELPKLAVTLPAVDSTGRISMLELALILICVILLLLAFCMLFYIAKYCKRRIKGELSGEYMVDSQTAGPRPYDVEQIDRKTAQTILSSRPLPDPYEETKTYDKKLNGSSPQNPVDNHDGLQYANRTLNVPLKARFKNICVTILVKRRLRLRKGMPLNFGYFLFKLIGRETALLDTK
ncbi:unnamed protein product [Anisakis simplex]|uniref:Cadherin domain-containing protein n=2 Tax=Anisakis simplex TaxID=6269 RepID=A0A3P6MZ59_ANISI|nr:unnamed protein product [Anisakis simplex]